MIAGSREEAKRKSLEMFAGKFGSRGNSGNRRKFLDGIEYSVFVITDGKNSKCCR
ncbi:MAG: hypothetical protein IPN18_18515 [Ignavibacteriales bacterium]|nr:hypothetical protein [Ignavibacteriales bacterium]